MNLCYSEGDNPYGFDEQIKAVTANPFLVQTWVAVTSILTLGEQKLTRGSE